MSEMKMTVCRIELQKKTLELQNELKKQNIDVFFDNDSFRDYLVRISVSSKGIFEGKLSLYYKPSKKTYSLKRQITNPKTNSIIESTWNKLNDFETYSSDSGIFEAFVDGSYISGVTGYGAVIYLGDEIKAELSGSVADTQFRQFGGELKSVIETLKWCSKNNVKKIRINYDYEGIEKFTNGKWKARNNLSMEYVNFLQTVSTEIEWRHVKSHTGNTKNDRADFLAKKATQSSQKTENTHETAPCVLSTNVRKNKIKKTTPNI
ncbi:MAG: reverse transcriptase-like protein [Endomicrobium sp.]|nr:reverse transcriptase-like protein [Endomicrobium sp.]